MRREIVGVGGAVILLVVLFLIWPGWALGGPIWDSDDGEASATDNGQTASSTPDDNGAQTPDGVLDAGGENPFFSQVSGGACQPGDKVGTWSEIADAGPQRIEVGGHGTQHLDFYPARGIKAVSYIVSTIANPDGTPSLAFGFGSLWEWNPPGCAYDYVADATQYARARLDSGHSGVVIDLRANPPIVAANVADMSEADVKTLLATHAAAMEHNGQKMTLNVSFGQANGSSGSSGSTSGACEPAVRKDREPKVNEAFSFNDSGGWVIINGWTNEPGQDQAEFTVLLSPSDNPALLVGGSYFVRPKGCETESRAEFDKGTLPKVSIADLQARGLVR